MKIGIYGGTFNPPHLGHFEAAKAAITQMNLDKLILIPAATPPHKKLPPDTPNENHRLAMTALMGDLLGERAEVSSIEIARGGSSYTLDTLEEIHAQYPDAQLFLFMGTDMFLSLEQWHRPADVMRLAHICAFSRSEDNCQEVFAQQKAHLCKTYDAQITIYAIESLIEISSTEVRTQLKNQQESDFLLPSVYGYIVRNGLYGVEKDLKNLDMDTLRACALSMVKAKRIAHILGVEKECAALAVHWGEDPQLARRAGILHDCTKYDTAAQHLEICQTYGVTLDELEKSTEKLLHAKTGACIARHVFGETDQVYHAIFCHTTAKENMSQLDKILYLADYMEENRSFDEVETLRTLAYQDINRAVLFGIELAIEEMRQRGKVIHPNSLKAKAWFSAMKFASSCDEN